MSNQDKERNVGSALWQSQVLEAPRISLEYVRYQVEKLNADFRRESFWAYAGVPLAALGFFWVYYLSPPATLHSLSWVVRVGAFLMVLAGVYSLFELRRRGSKLIVIEGAKISQTLDAYREELQRRRDLYSKVWRWALLPFIPVILFMIVGGVLVDPRPGKEMRWGITALFVIVCLLLAHWYNQRKGWRLQRELDALATLDTKQAQEDRDNSA